MMKKQFIFNFRSIINNIYLIIINRYISFFISMVILACLGGCYYHYIKFGYWFYGASVGGIVIGLVTFLLIKRIIHIKDNATKYIDSQFAKLLFDAHINKLTIAPIAMLLILGFIKFDCRFDLYIFIYTYAVILIVLLFLTSETTLNALFKIQQFIISVNKCIDEVFNSNSNSNSNSQRNSNSNSNTTFRVNLSGGTSFNKVLFRTKFKVNSNMSLSGGGLRFYSTKNNPGPPPAGAESNLANSVVKANDLVKNSLSQGQGQNQGQGIKRKIEDFLGGGYKGYQYIRIIGPIVELLLNQVLLEELIQLFLSQLRDDVTYTSLNVIRWVNPLTGLTQGITTGKSIKITKNTSAKLLAKRIQFEVNNAILKYKLNAEDAELIIMYREWLKLDEFKGSLADITKAIDDGLSKEEEGKKHNSTRVMDNEVKILKTIEELSYKNVLMDRYGEEIPVVIENNGSENAVSSIDIGYKLSEDEGVLVQKVKNKKWSRVQFS